MLLFCRSAGSGVKACYKNVSDKTKRNSFLGANDRTEHQMMSRFNIANMISRFHKNKNKKVSSAPVIEQNFR